MAALFPRWSNTAFGLALAALAAGVVALVAGPMILMRTPYATHEGDPVQQPVEFDHRHHVRDDEIACVYCHRTVETGARAGIPATEVCMGCHAQVWNRSPLLAPVRASWAQGTPIPWRRVHDLPDHVYFNHAVHVTGARLPCATCHGDVASMPRVSKAAPLTMGWCIDCHRQGGRALTPLTTCSACHR
jgi:hypothetical protein